MNDEWLTIVLAHHGCGRVMQHLARHAAEWATDGVLLTGWDGMAAATDLSVPACRSAIVALERAGYLRRDRWSDGSGLLVLTHRTATQERGTA